MRVRTSAYVFLLVPVLLAVVAFASADNEARVCVGGTVRAGDKMVGLED
jgi:hypothetical protein